MKVILSVLLLAIVAANARILSYDQYKDDWENFKIKFQKRYETDEEEQFRFKIFAESKQEIEEHNKKYEKGEVTYKHGINQFADMLFHEFSQTMNGYKPNLSHKKRINYAITKNVSDLPPSVNWVDKGAVTPVKNQWHCGSCWAFSTTGALEGRHFIKTGKLVSLSEQNLIDCTEDDGNFGCNGGDPDIAFQYVIDNKGIDTEESYPYEATDDTCRFNASEVGSTEVNYHDLPSGNEEALQSAVVEGPVSVAIHVTENFRKYSGGIFQTPECSLGPLSLNHAVLVVGYGYDEKLKLPYWLVKNSWSDEWGEKGYVRMLKGQNMCGVATSASYPVV